MRLKKITALFLTGALILSMAGCAGNGSKDKKEGSAGNEAQEPVKIATKPMTEQFILGEMLKKLIEEKAGYEVELTKALTKLQLKSQVNVNYIDKSKLTATASSYQHDGSDPKNVLDDNPSTMWHTDWNLSLIHI